MADTSFTLPGGQKIPKKTLLIGGAVLVVVLVVLMRRGQSAEPGEEGQFGAQGDLGEGEGAGGFGGSSDADLGSILAALSQMNQAPSQIYSPAPAQAFTLTENGGGDLWSSALLGDTSQDGMEEEISPAHEAAYFREYDSPALATDPYEAQKAEKARIRLERDRTITQAEKRVQVDRLASKYSSPGQSRVASYSRAARTVEQAARVTAKTIIKPAVSRAQERAPTGQLQRWYTPPRTTTQNPKTVKAVIRRSSVVARSPVQRV